MDQAMLGMPSREYYLTETDSEYKAAYLRYMINVAKLFDADEAVAARDMQDVLHFEELLANVSSLNQLQFCLLFLRCHVFCQPSFSQSFYAARLPEAA